MKKIIMLSMIVGHFTYAALPLGNFQNLNANYISPKGSATASNLNLDGFGSFRNPEMEVVNEDGLLKFQFEDNEFSVDLSLFAIRDADFVRVQGMSLENSKKEINLDFYEVEGSAVENEVAVLDADVSCRRVSTYTDYADDLLKSCLGNAKIEVTRFNYLSYTQNFSALIGELVSKNIELNNINVVIRNNYLQGNLSSNLTFGVPVSFTGRTNYDSKDKVISLRLDTAKAGFFDIRDKLFLELKRMAPEGVRIHQPYISITLK